MLYSISDKCFTNFSTKIFNTEFPLEFLITSKKSGKVSFCGKVLSGSKTKNGNSPHLRSTKYYENSTGLPF